MLQYLVRYLSPETDFLKGGLGDGVGAGVLDLLSFGRSATCEKRRSAYQVVNMCQG